MAGAAIAALVIVGATMPAVPTKKTAPPPKDFARIKALAAKWATKFSVPLPVVLAICQVESGFRPWLFNLNDRAVKIGGCWGVVAMSLLYGAEKIAQMRGKLSGDPDVRAVLAAWHPQATVANLKPLIAKNRGYIMPDGKNRSPGWDATTDQIVALAQPLLNPDVCLALGVYMMSGLWLKYKDLAKVAAAYHSGQGPVDAAIKAGVPVETKLGPYGREYVSRAQTAFRSFA